MFDGEGGEENLLYKAARSRREAKKGPGMNPRAGFGTAVPTFPTE